MNKLRKGLSTLYILFCIPCLAQSNVTFPEANPDTAWAALERALPRFASNEEYKAWTKLPPLENKRVEDNWKLRIMELAGAFWDAYPKDERRDKARGVFIGIDPYFIDNISERQKQVLDSIPRREWSRFMRSLPVDNSAREQWLQKGNSMVATVLASNAPAEEKEAAAFSLFARDFRDASRYFGSLPKEATENSYWEVMDAAYWEQFRLRFESHIRNYAELPVLADRAKDFLSALKGRSPEIAASYWRSFSQIGREESNDPLADKTGIKALQKAAAEQLEALVVEAGDKPVEMQFIALDGRKVDLLKLRGKVVLIDFWATWCKPCLAEIPRLKEMYKKYREKGFEVIGISLDEETARDRVKEIIQTNKVSWPQRFEGKGFAADSYKQLYGINVLPTVWLLDKEGKIADRNARGEKLEPLIRKHLGL